MPGHQTPTHSKPNLVECPACNGMGYGFPLATVGMWAGLVPWDDGLRPEVCDLCGGAGYVSQEVAAEYEALALEA